MPGSNSASMRSRAVPLPRLALAGDGRWRRRSRPRRQLLEVLEPLGRRARRVPVGHGGPIVPVARTRRRPDDRLQQALRSASSRASSRIRAHAWSGGTPDSIWPRTRLADLRRPSRWSSGVPVGALRHRLDQGRHGQPAGRVDRVGDQLRQRVVLDDVDVLAHPPGQRDTAAVGDAGGRRGDGGLRGADLRLVDRLVARAAAASSSGTSTAEHPEPAHG